MHVKRGRERDRERGRERISSRLRTVSAEPNVPNLDTLPTEPPRHP